MVKIIKKKNIDLKELRRPLIVHIKKKKHLAFGRNESVPIANFFRDASGVVLDDKYSTAEYWRDLVKGRFKSTHTIVVVAEEGKKNVHTRRRHYRITQVTEGRFCSGECCKNKKEKMGWGRENLRCWCADRN